MNLIEDLIEHNPIDLNRIHIVEMLMGDFAIYDLICRHPEVFTAAPIYVVLLIQSV